MGKITLLLKKRHRPNKSAKSKPPQKGMAKKKRCQNLDNQSFDTLISTRSRGRTGTTLLSLVFETNASTDSAIRANLIRRIGMAKIVESLQFSKNPAIFQKKP